MKYRFNGDGPVDVPDLHGRVTLDAPREEVFPLQPGDVFSTDLDINNSTFELLDGAASPEPQPAAPETPAPVDPTPEPEAAVAAPEAPQEV